MAGNYPDVPGKRMAYDRDGSIMASWDSISSNVTEHSTGNKQTVNNEAGTDYVSWGDPGNGYTRWLTILFPEKRDLDAYYIRIASSDGLSSLRNFAPGAVRTSANSTNGLDGTWTSHGNWSYDLASTAIDPAYRNNIDTLSVSGVQAIQFRWTDSGGWFDSQRFYTLHLYGDIAAGEFSDRLTMWHPTLDQQVDGAYFDWGDVERNTAAQRTFRIKNLSSTYTAQDVTLSTNALTDTSPTVVGQHTYSDDLISFTTTLNIGNLAPGATSSVITVRRTTPSNATLSLWAARIIATAASGWV